MDHRLKFVVPVYGCGFISHGMKDGSQWVGRDESPERVAKWRDLWDPCRFLPGADVPMLWVTGTNDIAFTPRAWQLSYRFAPGTRFLSQRLNMPHSQAAGATPEEILAFADSVVRGRPPLIRVTAAGKIGSRAWVEYESRSRLTSSALVFTRESGAWQNRQWEKRPAMVNAERRFVYVDGPMDAVAWFFELTDERGLMVSSPHQLEEKFPVN